MASVGQHELSPKRIRVLLDKTYVADTTSAQLVWEHQYYPCYYIPVKDVKSTVLTEGIAKQSGICNVGVRDKAPNKVTLIVDGDLKDHVRFEFSAMGG